MRLFDRKPRLNESEIDSRKILSRLIADESELNTISNFEKGMKLALSQSKSFSPEEPSSSSSFGM